MMTVLEVAAMAAQLGARGDVKTAAALMQIIQRGKHPDWHFTANTGQLGWSWSPPRKNYLPTHARVRKEWFDQLEHKAHHDLVLRYYETEAEAYLALAQAIVRADDLKRKGVTRCP